MFACSEFAAPCDADSACEGDLVCSEGLCIEAPIDGADALADAGQAEVFEEADGDIGAPETTSWVEDSGTSDVEQSEDDGSVTEDADTSAGDPTDPGAFGDPCEDDLDCASGLCVVHMGDEVCSKTCDSECPSGWSCEQVVLGGSDPVFICVSAFEHLCQPCIEASDCESLLSAAACVSYGEEGSFCGAVCEESADCPADFVCQEGVSTRGGTSKQCVHDSGVCPCSTLATDMGLATQCDISNDYGTCSALRVCTDEGLSECDASVPVAESCNGVDDDCDDETDEGALCDDDNACTTDSCAGAEGCVHEILEGTPCDDGDPNTEGDLCGADGVCAGEPVECPLTDCMLESVSTDGECLTTYQPDGFPCDDEAIDTYGDVCDGAGGCAGTSYSCAPTQCELTSEANGTDCTVTYVEEGSGCDDEDLNTAADVCDGAGACIGTPFTCEPGVCELTATPNGTDCTVAYTVQGAACDDEDPSTASDNCDGAGGCSGTPITCELGVCELSSEPNGVDCTITYLEQGAVCDDDDLATSGDGCDGAGGCAGSPITCELGVCELTSEANGVDCTVTYAEQGATCDDGDVATADDACDGAGGCAGTPLPGRTPVRPMWVAWALAFGATLVARRRRHSDVSRGQG